MTLKAESISKRSRNAWTLRDITFEAAPGEVFGIAGASAPEAVALMRILSGSDRPNAGRVLLNSAPAGSFSYLSHTPTGRTAAFRQLFSGRGDAGYDRRAIDSVLSSPILLLDNIFCGINEELKRSEFERIRKLVREKGTIAVFAASGFDDVLLFCDRAAVMRNGELLQTDTPENLYLSPDSTQVARLTGRCNIFEARRLSSSKADVPEFQTIGGEHRLITGKTEKSRLGALNRNVFLAIRPEHVSISFGASFPEDNLLKATIKEARFLGPNTLVRLDAGGLELESLVMRLVGLKPGDECMLGMPPGRIMVFTE